MQKRKWKNIALWSTGIFLSLVVILLVHIWWVMKPRIDGSTRVMARIDIHQPINQQQADQIQAWLYQQKGVKHVLVSPVSGIAIFSFAPVETNGNRVVTAFRTRTGYQHAERYLPVVNASSSGCPVAATSFAYKVYAFMNRIL